MKLDSDSESGFNLVDTGSKSDSEDILEIKSVWIQYQG